MKLPRWQELVLAEGVVPEAINDENRIVLWIKLDKERSFQHWERIGNVARGDVSSRNGLAATAATSIRAGNGSVARLARSSMDCATGTATTASLSPAVGRPSDAASGRPMSCWSGLQTGSQSLTKPRSKKSGRNQRDCNGWPISCT